MQTSFPRFFFALLTLPFAPALLAQTGYVTIGRTAIGVVNPATQKQVANLFGGSRPTAMVTSPDGNTIYVADSGSQSVTIVDAVHNSVQSQVSVGQPITELAVSSDGRYLYFVSDSLTYINKPVHPAIVTKFDLSTNKTVLSATLSQSSTVYSVSVSADGSTLYVPLSSDSGIAVLDTATLTIQSVIQVSKSAGPAVVGGTTAWMLCGEAICRIDLTTGTLLNTSAGNYGPFCLSPDLTKLYVFPAEGFVYVLDAVALTVEQQIPNPYEGYAGQILVSPDGKTLYAATSGSISWYDTQTYTLQGEFFSQLQTFSVSASNMIFEVQSDNYPGNSIGILNLAEDKISSEFTADWFSSLSISPDGSKLYGSNLVALFSLNLAPKSTPTDLVNGGTSVIGYSTDGSLLYLNTLDTDNSATGIDSVSVATGQIVNQYGYTGNWGYGATAVISPDGTHIYFDNYASELTETPIGISVLDTTTFSAAPVLGATSGFNPVAVSPDGPNLLVEPITSANNQITSAGLSFLNLASGHITSAFTYPTPIFPFASSFAVGPKNVAFYALTQDMSGNLTFTAFNPNTLAVLHTYPLGPNTGFFAISSDETHAYISLAKSRSILDLNLPSFSVHATIPTGFAPGAIVISPN